MTDPKSYNSKTSDSKNLKPGNSKSFEARAIQNSSTRRARVIGGATTAAATAVMVLMIVLDFNGCSSSKDKKGQITPVQSSANSVTSTPAPSPTPASLETKIEAVVAKKKTSIKRASTATYTNSTYGVSFRYPKTYTMLTPEKNSKESAWPDPVAMNFAEPGGQTLTTLVLPGTRASSYFKASIVKGVSEEQCNKFASTPEQSEVAANPPVDAADDSISPVKSNILGVEFAKTENVTEQSEARYYHHFENGACYEFALGVEDAPGTIKPIDHLQVFDKLERIMTTVKIKTAAAPVVATSETSTEPVPANSSQQ